jgi:hypothetical protein
MGYRSEVTAVFYTAEKDEWPLLKLFVEENFPKDLADCLRAECEESCNTWGFVFSVSDYKWYDSYPEVQAFNEFEEKFKSLQKCVDGAWACEFARIGEDYTDIENRSSNHADYILRVIRNIEIEF